MNDAYRHVCFKDLENYFNRYTCFGDLTESERELIRFNLGVPSKSDLFDKGGGIVIKTYEELKSLVDSKMLSVNCKYIISNFRTIYISNTGEIWGTDDVNPSKEYSLVLTPISESEFDPRVLILENGKALDWTVNYNFTQETLVETATGKIVKTKGKITYLKDQNNNSAYYDFKNIKFRVNIQNNEIAGLSQNQDFDLYTFSDMSSINDVKDSSNYSYINNNQIDYDCYLNVFLGTTNNNHFYGGFKNNIFLKDCTFNKFEWNTHDNKFRESVMYTQGTLQHAVVGTTSYDSAVSKEFKMVQVSDSAEPVFIVTRYDGDTLTTLVNKLTKI